MFSIHEYLLPDGYVDEKSLETAVLLFRTERVYNLTGDGIAHNNWGLPKYYEMIYPKTLTNQRVGKQLHFHFSEGVGSIYKLDDVSDNKNKNNFSSGYAIPLSNIHSYIKKIYFSEYDSRQEHDFYLKNDFGLHFLYLINDIWFRYYADCMYEYKFVRNNPTKEIIWTSELCDCISITNIFINQKERDFQH